MVRRQWLLFQLISCLCVGYGEYLGCYRESEERLMKGHQQNFIFTLTPDRCVNLCASKGFRYAGLKGRIACFCDQNAPLQQFRGEESLCQTRCVGDNSTICGGYEALSVYATKLAHREDMIEMKPDSFIGCYKENVDVPLLPSHVQELKNNNSPQKCKDICYRLGFLYAGMKSGVQCFCGDSHPLARLLRNSTDCVTPCSGDPNSMCGGPERLSVHDTGITDITAQGKKLGCFDDEDPRVLEGFKIDLELTNSPQRCLNLCRNLNYDYCGVEYGVECFCGNILNANTSRDSGDVECNATCPGDIFETCGANWELTAYSTGLTDPEPIFKKLGCFSTGSQLQMAFRQDFSHPITSAKCASLCYNKGFYYATLVSRNQCWCDNEAPPQSMKITIEDCKDVHAVFYQTGQTVIQHGKSVDYIGCFNDNGKNSILRGVSHKFESQLTPEKCSQWCFNKGYLYSGTKNKNKCHCGDKLPEDASAMVENKECSSSCSGDRHKHCGGSTKMSVYSTGMSDIPITGKLIGCFVDEFRPRALDGHKTDLEKTNSPRRCLNYCLQLGFKFAGMEYQKECFCGNSRPNSTQSVPDSECDSICSGDSSKTCGGGWRIEVYRTGLETINPEFPTLMPTSKPDCELSETLLNGKPVCRGTVVFRDDFTTPAIASHWQHEIKIADAPDYEFVMFTSDSTNSYQREGKLVIKPTLQSDRDVRGGNVTLNRCTGLAGSRECELTAFSYNILPPVRSARIHTRQSFNFRYGVVEIRARLPAGDWLVPELWLLPKDQSYGTNYLSGKVRVAMSRGNRYLTCNGQDIGSSTLESGVLVGTEFDVKTRSVVNKITDCWYSYSHNYTLVWTPDNLSFYVDGQSQQALLPPRARLSELLGFDHREGSVWNTGSRIAPFDTDFYLALGVSAGSVRDFPDGCVSKDKVKPWRNFKLKAMLNFWLNKESWQPSWDDNKSSLIVEHVQVTAL